MKKEFMKSPSGHWLNYLNIIRSAQIISLDWQMKKSKIENSLELFFFCRKGTLYCPKGLVGRGYPRGTSFLLDLLWGSGTHWGGVPGFLLLFSIKSKGGMLYFAKRVPNGWTSYLHQTDSWLEWAHSVQSTANILARLRPIAANPKRAVTESSATALSFYSFILLLWPLRFFPADVR